MLHSNDIFVNIKQKMKNKEWIIAVGIDDLTQEKICRNAGCDLILFYPTAKYAAASNRFLTGFLAFGNTNDMMIDTGSNLFPMISARHLMAGLNGWDPLKNDQILLDKMREFGFTGIHNYPTMALVDGNFAMNLDNLKSGFDKEVLFFKKARERGFHTCGMVRTAKQAIQLVRANVEVLIFYLGLGEEKEKNPEQIIHRLKELTSSVRKVSKDIPILFHCEQITSVNEIFSIAKEVEEINGYFSLPIAQKNMSLKKLELEILELKKIRQTSL